MMTAEDRRFTIDVEELAAFTQELVRCKSWNPPGDEAEAGALLAERLRRFGLEVETQPVAPERHNVYGRLRGRGGGPGDLLLVGHLDTVPPGSRPWERDPLSGTVEDGRVYGLGAADMKGGLAALAFAAGALVESGFEPSSDLVIAGTVGEEVDCCGAVALAGAGLLQGASAIGIPEPSGLELYAAHKGALWMRIVVKGRAAHGSRPDLGANAILQMQETIRRVVAAAWDAPPHPLLGTPTLNVATIHGGTKTNVVPDRCELTIDFRTLPGQAHGDLVARLERILEEQVAPEEGYEASLEVLNDRPAVATPVDAPFVEAARAVGRELWGAEMVPGGASYFTDASVLAPGHGLPVIILGPGEVSRAHRTDEWVEVDALGEAARFYAELAARWLR